MDLSNIVAALGNVSSLTRFSENTKKREHAEPMDIEEVDTASTPKRRKVEQGRKMIQVKKNSGKSKLEQKKQKQEQPKADGLELQEYVFDGVATNNFASKVY